MCYVRKYVYFSIFITFKSLPGLDLRRFVYPQTFSTNGTPIRLILIITQISSKKLFIALNKLWEDNLFAIIDFPFGISFKVTRTLIPSSFDTPTRLA